MLKLPARGMPCALFALIPCLCLAAPPDSPLVQKGRQQFQQACGFCHGEDAAGSRAPDLIRSPLVNRDKDGDLIGPVVKNGRPDKGMPAFPFSDEQIREIAAFLHSQTLKALRSASVPRDYPLSRLLTGDAAAGKSYFASHCVSCHSPGHSAGGDLAKVATRYKPLDLQQRFLYPRGAHSTATVTLPSGQQVKGTLLHLDDFSVAIRDSDGWYRSWHRDDVKVEEQDPLAGHRELLNQYTDSDIHNVFAYLETLK